jgi:hypothetical protein
VEAARRVRGQDRIQVLFYFIMHRLGYHDMNELTVELTRMTMSLLAVSLDYEDLTGL